MELLEISLRRPEVMVLLNIMKKFSQEVYDHCYSVAKYTEIIVKDDDDFTDSEKIEVVSGALLHDIGKIFVPFNLTAAPKRLDPTEFILVKTHTVIGYEMLKDSFSEIVCNIARYHHEQPNGSGYMSEMPLSRIPKEALLVQVADIYDALISKRTYKNCYESGSALEIMKNDSRNMKLDDGYLKRLQQYVDSQKK